MLKRRTVVSAAMSAACASLVKTPNLLAADDEPLMIDSHVHVWKHDPAYPFAKEAHPPAEDYTAETLLGLMKENGISRTVIIQVIHYRWDNSYLADVLKRYPAQFKGVCRVNPEDPAAPDHLSRLTEEQGFHGVRISPSANADGDWIRGPLMPPLWKRCAQLKVPMTVLTPVTRLPDVVPLIEQNPDLAVVIDHMADSPVTQPEKLDLLLQLEKYPKLFVKISHMWSLSKLPYPYSDSQAQVRRIYDKFGAKRLMWGTDWPICLAQLPYAKAVELFRDHFDFMPPGDHEWILSKTVQQVWPFGL
jgi:L-fuconolactonase